jgi:long-subunit acyl-CoA synthetase (AMP-forming)
VKGVNNEMKLYNVGYIFENVEEKVVDENGKMVKFGKNGEIWIRGYIKMLY